MTGRFPSRGANNRAILTLTLAVAANLMAQETATSPSVPSGSITFGYRFTDINGYQPKYTELFGLNSGFRVTDFNLFSKPDMKATPFMDSYSLTSSGLGGDPFTTTQLTLRKRNVYELRANFRQTRYYWNQNDATLPGGIPGLTANQSWATVRKLGSINLLVHATDHLRFSFEYGRNTRDGTTFTTRPIDFFGSSTAWGSFARANPYYMIAPLSEETNRIAGGVDYTKGLWALHYKAGYQSFEDAVNPKSGGPFRSINTDPATASATAFELLNGSNWADHRKLTGPFSEFSYTGRILSRVDLRGSYLFFRYGGPATLNMSSDGTARSNAGGTAFAPYAVSMTSSAKLTEPNHVVDQGATVRITSWWSANVDYRYSRSTTTGIADFRSIFNGVLTAGTSDNEWDITLHTLDLNTTFTPTTGLLIRGGVRLMRNDVTMLQDGVVDPTRTKLMHTAWPVGSLHWEPNRVWTVKLDFDQMTNVVPYTRIMPDVDVGGRYVVRFRPYQPFYIEYTGVIRNRTQLASDFRSTIRTNAATFNFQFDPAWTVFAGLSYDSYFSSNFVNFLRGPAPFTNLSLLNQTVSRVWQGGVRGRPTEHLELSFTGNFVRTNGVSEFAGEAPWYGGTTFPYATAVVSYDVQRVGRLGIQLQRSYYAEDIVPTNNFSANLLSILYTRSF